FEVTPLDMAVAYGVLSNMGERVDATGITKIVGKDGRIVYENKTNPVRVVSTESSFVMTDIFKDVLYYYFPQFKNMAIACKSGTAGDFTSGWFIGYTNDFVVSCYVGSDKELIGLEGVKNWGRRFAGEIWKDIMTELIKIKKPVDWVKPEKVVYRAYCSKTGLIKNNNCKGTRYDLYIINTNIPFCSYHREYKVYVCKNNENLLANKNCSEEFKKLKIFYDPDDIPKNYCNCDGLFTEVKLIAPSSVLVETPVILEVQTDFKIGDTLEFDINGEKTFVTSPPLKMMWYPTRSGKYYISIYLWSFDGVLKGKTGKEINVVEPVKNSLIIINPTKPKLFDKVTALLMDAPNNTFSVIVFINDEMKGVLLEEPYSFVFEVSKKGKYKIVYKVYDLYGETILTLYKEFTVN
ncbi:MAG: penicillin-binding transpeptidase domain-containing protein, partial [Caldisericia bacterium]